MRFPFCKAAVLLALCLGTNLSQAATSTHSFSNKAQGSHPSTVTYASGKVTVDLGALPAGSQVYRAILVPHRTGNKGGGAYATQPLRVEASDEAGVWLQTQAPRHMNLDCTAAVQRAIARSPRQLVLNIVSFGGLGSSGAEIRLDVWCDQPAASSIQQVTNVQAVHSTGDTMITFTEVNTPLTDPNTVGSDFRTAVANLDAAGEIRYRIYRSSTPITQASIRSAELVDEIQPLSGWNEEYFGIERNSSWSSLVVPRLPIAHMTQADVGTGIYVRRAQAAGSAYYAVSRSVNGEEDLSTWTAGGNCVATPVNENTGTGMVLQWDERTYGSAAFLYVFNATSKHYVRWECPPDTYNMPNTVCNYMVAIPPTVVDPRPVDISLHGWSGWEVDASGWWFEDEAGTLLVTTTINPYDWWTAFHDNYGTIRPFTPVDGNAGGVVRNYTQNRVLSFLDNFVKAHWNVDDNHVILSGVSMGGSGASMWGQRANDRFAYIVSWVGVHIPLLSPQFKSSFDLVFGLPAWNCEYLDTGMSAWDYWDTDQWLRTHVSTDTPFITFSNGKNDSAIGWYQAWLHLQALIETRRPFIFKWGLGGHTERPTMPGRLGDRRIGIDIDHNKTLPAFTHCSLDNDPGNGDRYVGDDAGMINAYMLWEPGNSVDTAQAWEMNCLLIAAAPQATCTVDVTPRRCQAFGPRPGMYCEWTNTDIATGSVIESGIVQVDTHGLVNVPQATVKKTKSRIAVTIVGDIEPDGSVDVVDLLHFVDAFGSVTGDGNYNAACDLNHDDSVDVVDLLMLVDNFGK